MNCIVEQNPMASMLGDKGACMMEDGINKLASLPKWEHLAPQLSGAAPKKSFTDSLFSLPPSDEKMPAIGNKQEQWMPVHFKTAFKDDNLRQRQGVMVLLPSGIQLASDVIAVVQSEGTILKVSVKVPGAVMDPKRFLRFQRKGIYRPLMEMCAGARISAFYETMSTVHTSLCDSMWREFQLNLDFPCMEDIPIHAVSRLEESVFVYIELIAREKTTYMQANGRLSGDIVDMNEFSEDDD